ncbi:MAG TPA: hypothetical protein V6C89_05655 [Drouetiella sp.]|jgi:hypothetical protein
MIEPECNVVIVEPSTELEPPSNQSVYMQRAGSQTPGRIKSDWWSLRADLKPMSEYRMNRPSFK